MSQNQLKTHIKLIHLKITKNQPLGYSCLMYDITIKMIVSLAINDTLFDMIKHGKLYFTKSNCTNILQV